MYTLSQTPAGAPTAAQPIKDASGIVVLTYNA